jgi:cardiolipin synthase (CMP-forming)
VAGQPAQGSARVLTIPNLVSFARLAGVPLFLYLVLGPHEDGWAVVVLAIGGTSDWVDGFLARRLNQTSRLGELLDPLADRLYIVATVIALTIRDVVPLWFTLALLARELLLGVCLLVLRRYGYGPPPVHYVGKSATFILLLALPILLLAKVSPGTEVWAYPTGWSLAWWGLVLYWIAALFYVVQLVGVVRAGRPAPAGQASA